MITLQPTCQLFKLPSIKESIQFAHRGVKKMTLFAGRGRQKTDVVSDFELAG